ncbi:nicotinate-nucleotide pyrophosphorylase [carboxylating], chloroplastic-like [Asparagus officinalis]|uniref:nicotinate-nucleotide pyrophosphorylase [carboxylating], chloroplastic-like n=1 Tax=Asparagus officinalis TaxID=4686 RepID=UPI00098E147E|nr:nicotinate-nucleotide pyrophosphorylase [carboxylating], chloroplastic-like [Asparagus officinalis]
MSAIYLVKNQVFHVRIKHINVRYHFVRDVLEDGDVELVNVCIKDNPVDMLTKVVPTNSLSFLLQAMAEAAHPACILETRKTAPGLRLVDKWAVLIGGGKNHRMGLFDMVMIKDNHISIAGGVTNAIKSVDQYLEEKGLHMAVEVETRTLEEVMEVLQYAIQNNTSLTRIMLDNMVVPLPNGDVDISMLKEAVDLINGRFETEASGNVTLETVKKIGKAGVTYISSCEI